MNRIIFIILLIIIPLFSKAQENPYLQSDTLKTDTVTPLPWPIYMTARLDSAIRQNPVMKYSRLGMKVYDLTADSVIYSLNEKQLLVPASNEKIVTSITAIERLGRDFPFRTRLYHTGSISVDSLAISDTLATDTGTIVQTRFLPKRVLHGDVYAVGSFDPAFDGYDLHQFAAEFSYLNIDSIDGALYEDVSIKDTIRWNKSWLWKQHADNPDISPLMVNKKSGFMLQFQRELNHRHIPVRGVGVCFGICPDSAKLVVEKVRTLNQLLPRLMKNSDNIYAESIFYQIGAFSYRKFRNADDTETALNQQIRKAGYSNPSEFTLLDGSGLSHFNYLTPDYYVRILGN